MKNILLSTLIFLLLAPLSSFAKDKETVTITPVSEDADAANGGIVYSLPQTTIRIRLTAQVVVSTAGPFFKYSTKYLNLTDVVTANNIRWSLLSADVETSSVPDASHTYKMSASSSSIMPSVALSSSGVICGFNVEPTETAEPQDVPAPTLSYASFDDVQLPQSVLARTSTAAMAEETATAIYNLRTMRLDLLTGAKEAQLPDAGAYNRVLQDIDKQEAAHISLFAGRRDTFTVVKYVTLTPDPSEATTLVPIRFSESDGFVDALDLNGLPIYVDFKFYEPSRINAYAATSKQRKSAPLTGFRYFNPASVNVTVSDRNIRLTSVTVPCTQGAQEMSLPADMLQTHSIKINPTTGALLYIQNK